MFAEQIHKNLTTTEFSLFTLGPFWYLYGISEPSSSAGLRTNLPLEGARVHIIGTCRHKRHRYYGRVPCERSSWEIFDCFGVTDQIIGQPEPDCKPDADHVEVWGKNEVISQRKEQKEKKKITGTVSSATKNNAPEIGGCFLGGENGSQAAGVFRSIDPPGWIPLRAGGETLPGALLPPPSHHLLYL